MSDTPEPQDAADLLGGPDLAPEPHPRLKRRNVVGLVALFLGGMPNIVLLLVWAGLQIGDSRTLGEIIAWSALLALPVGLIASILSWTKVFRFRDWWFGLTGLALGIGFFLLLTWILRGIDYGFPGG